MLESWAGGGKERGCEHAGAGDSGDVGGSRPGREGEEETGWAARARGKGCWAEVCWAGLLGFGFSFLYTSLF